MSERVGKRFSNIRYWRYVFTPLIFLSIIFGLFMLYNSESKTTTTNFPAMTGILRRNTNSASLNSVLSQIQKYST